MSNNENFYANKYWQEGQGLQLWQARLMVACIEQIGDYNLPKPFFTILTNERTDEHYGYCSSWEMYNTYSLTIEIERKELFIYGYRMVEDEATKKLSFEDEISFGFGDEKDADNNPWSDLPEAINKTREWFHSRFKDLPANNEKQVLSLVKHLI
jgi:hypothetical protein